MEINNITVAIFNSYPNGSYHLTKSRINSSLASKFTKEHPVHAKNLIEFPTQMLSDLIKINLGKFKIYIIAN